MWALIFGFAFILVVAGFLYLTSRVYRLLPAEKRLAPKREKNMRVFVSVCAVLICALFFAATLGYVNAALVVIHLMAFWLLADFVFYIVKKCTGKRMFRLSSCVAVAVTFVYLAVGYVLANNVWITHYDLYTDKLNGDLRIVMLADSHVGSTFSGNEFGNCVTQMQSYNPDIVVIAGDYVDDDTSRQDMIDACAALGKLRTTYGVFYAFGNHDKGYYDNSVRGYNGDDLIAELIKNGVTVLEDDIVVFDDFYVVGRSDASQAQRGGRATIAELIDSVDKKDKDKYSVIINHQPTDYVAESAAKADLVLSGHTHGGQMFPIGLISDIFGLNDMVYGKERRDGTDFIVTSGISDWAFMFKIGCKSEFVVMDIHGK